MISQKSKKEIRQKFRDPGASSASESASQALSTRLVEFLRTRPGTWASYQPTSTEPDIRPAMAALPSCDFVFPRVEGETLSFFRTEKFVASRWGILEPDPECSDLVALRDLTGLLIPGVAFDLKCNRLGRGGGYYDRTLAEIRDSNPEAQKIGIALERQISFEDLPTESFDIPMNWVVTEKRCLVSPEKRTSP